MVEDHCTRGLGTRTCAPVTQELVKSSDSYEQTSRCAVGMEAIAMGTPVCIKGIASKVELNGQVTKVVGGLTKDGRQDTRNEYTESEMSHSCQSEGSISVQ